jgi:molecular chaperone GrpE (heat shock protein)
MFDNPNFLELILVNLLVVAGILIALRYSKPVAPIAATVDRTAEIASLKQECLNLREQLQQQSNRLASEHQEATFQELQSLLTQYHSVRQMVQANPELSAKNLIAIFTPLDNLLQKWQYKTIGVAWQQVPFDPQLHQSDRPDIVEGEMVYVRFVGYQANGDRILVPAKVSRTLPNIASNIDSNVGSKVTGS